MSFSNINHVRNILDACIDGDNFKLEELLKQNYTPSYNPPLPSYNPPLPSYNPPLPSYNPPLPSYNPPLPSYNPPSKLDENKQSEIDKNKQSEIDKNKQSEIDKNKQSEIDKNKQSEIDKIVKNIEKISIHNKCPYVLKKGKNKGKVCNVKSRNNNLYCSKHNK